MTTNNSKSLNFKLSNWDQLNWLWFWLRMGAGGRAADDSDTFKYSAIYIECRREQTACRGVLEMKRFARESLDPSGNQLRVVLPHRGQCEGFPWSSPHFAYKSVIYAGLMTFFSLSSPSPSAHLHCPGNDSIIKILYIQRREGKSLPYLLPTRSHSLPNKRRETERARHT